MFLFNDANNNKVTVDDFINAFDSLKVHNAKYLYIHSDLSFGIPNAELSRKEILGTLLDTILSTGVDNIIFSTFTFSFPNNEPYNVKTSKTLMGALNDFARKDSRGVRSLDPMMSNVHFGKDRTLVTEIGKYSCGENSTYHKLEQSDNVLFLFFGVHPAKCFTYSHFIEERLKVPYRYNQAFTGNITDYNGNTYEDTYQLFVRGKGVVAGGDLKFIDEAYHNGALHDAKIGNSAIYTYDKDKITDIYVKNIKNNPLFMLGAPIPNPLIKEYVVEKYPVIAL